MNKYELLKSLQMHLSEIVEEDMTKWEELFDTDQYEEIDMDRNWHYGFASAIIKLEELLND